MPHVGITIRGLRSAFWTLVGLSVKEWAAEQDITLSLIPASTGSDQAMALEEFVRQRVDAVIIGALSPNEPTFMAALRMIGAAGMPVIAIDAKLNGEVAICTVCADHMRGIELAVVHLVEQLGGQGKVAHIQGDLGIHFGRDRSQGVHNVLEQHPGIEIVFEASGDWRRESGAALMRAALAAHPDLEAVISANDSMALGALDVISAAGRAGQVLVIGFDALPEALVAIQRGKLLATVRQFPRQLVATTMDLTMRVLRGEPVPLVTLTKVDLITTENLLDAAMDALEVVPLVVQTMVEQSEAQQRVQQKVIEAQRGTIQQLSTPIIPITDQILVLPLIGEITSTRAQQVMEKMLEAIITHRAEVLIVDITGVALIDTQVADYLLKASRAVQLLGSTTILVGITPEVAQTIVQLGIDLSGIVTHSNLQSGLAYARALVGRAGSKSSTNAR
ncbi:MAG: substrate-binding domain-containing protein [Roseiflexaceae bacterium]